MFNFFIKEPAPPVFFQNKAVCTAGDLLLFFSLGVGLRLFSAGQNTTRWLTRCILTNAAMVEKAFLLLGFARSACKSDGAISAYRTWVLMRFSVSEQK